MFIHEHGYMYVCVPMYTRTKAPIAMLTCFCHAACGSEQSGWFVTKTHQITTWMHMRGSGLLSSQVQLRKLSQMYYDIYIYVYI